MNYLSETMCEYKAFNWSLQDFFPNWKKVINPTVPTVLISGIVDGATLFEVIKLVEVRGFLNGNFGYVQDVEIAFSFDLGQISAPVQSAM